MFKKTVQTTNSYSRWDELGNTTTRQGNISLSPTFLGIFIFTLAFLLFFSQLNYGGRLIGWGGGPYREARFDSSVAL